jgi:hypothetical protein
MIDWVLVIANSFWIAGAAIILAALSYYYWLAQQRREALRHVFGGREFQQFLLMGLILIGIGLAGTSRNTFQAIPAILLIIGSVVALFTLRRVRSQS